MIDTLNHHLKILDLLTAEWPLNQFSVFFVQMDFSLSFLDDFISEALELGAMPYRAASLRLCQPPPQKLELAGILKIAIC